MIHDELSLLIYFGDKSDALYPSQYLQWGTNDLMGHVRAKGVADALSVDDLLFLLQVHDADGFVVTHEQRATMRPFFQKGDFLITREPRLGIGVMTADCLPVVCYDARVGVVAVAHAGWRGAVAGVVESMITAMQAEYDTRLSDLIFFFGPAAQRCCYEVDEAFMMRFSLYPFYDALFSHGDGSIYFDLPGFVCNRLAGLGIERWQIQEQYQQCTICNFRFFSHRRATRSGKADQEGRQMTVVSVK